MEDALVWAGIATVVTLPFLGPLALVVGVVVYFATHDDSEEGGSASTQGSTRDRSKQGQAAKKRPPPRPTSTPKKPSEVSMTEEERRALYERRAPVFEGSAWGRSDFVRYCAQQGLGEPPRVNTQFYKHATEDERGVVCSMSDSRFQTFERALTHVRNVDDGREFMDVWETGYWDP